MYEMKCSFSTARECILDGLLFSIKLTTTKKQTFCLTSCFVGLSVCCGSGSVHHYHYTQNVHPAAISNKYF